MAANRFSSLYFAIQIIKADRCPITAVFILIAFVIAVVFTVMGLPSKFFTLLFLDYLNLKIIEDCGFLYLPETLEWLSEEADCAVFQYNLLLYSIFGCAVISNSMNLVTAGKLLLDKV